MTHASCAPTPLTCVCGICIHIVEIDDRASAVVVNVDSMRHVFVIGSRSSSESLPDPASVRWPDCDVWLSLLVSNVNRDNFIPLVEISALVFRCVQLQVDISTSFASPNGDVDPPSGEVDPLRGAGGFNFMGRQMASTSQSCSWVSVVVVRCSIGTTVVLPLHEMHQFMI